MKYTYTNKQTGQIEEVEMQAWVWGVIYKDGSELKQYDDNGVFHQIGEIEQDKVHTFIMYKPGDETRRFDIVLPEGASIIHKYKNYVFSALTKFEYRTKVYVFGYKIGSHHHYNFILPTDVVFQSTEEIALDKLLYKE